MMAWQDRPYFQGPDSGSTSPLGWLLYGSVPLFRIFGIQVRAHASLVVVLGLILLLGLNQGAGLWGRVQGATVLFAIVLLHEFGHCFAARRMGGEADEILMTPLGGLAFTMAPRRPWPTFVTVAGGPAVNVALCLICGTAMYFLSGTLMLHPWSFGAGYPPPEWEAVYGWLYWVYVLSYILLLFNLLPIWPLDGGQMLQSILWRPMGYYRSMLLTLNIGLAGSILLFAAGVVLLASPGGGLLTLLIALMCFLNCLSLRRQMLAEGPWAFAEEDEAVDYSTSALEAEPRRRPGFFHRRALRKAARRVRAEQQEQQKVDEILAKISARGQSSLTWRERRILERAREHMLERER